VLAAVVGPWLCLLPLWALECVGWRCGNQGWFKGMPGVTKFYMTLSLLAAVLSAFEWISPLQLYLNADLVMTKMEARRDSLLVRSPVRADVRCCWRRCGDC
jgi:hypothetical protein